MEQIFGILQKKNIWRNIFWQNSCKENNGVTHGAQLYTYVVLHVRTKTPGHLLQVLACEKEDHTCLFQNLLLKLFQIL